MRFSTITYKHFLKISIMTAVNIKGQLMEVQYVVSECPCSRGEGVLWLKAIYNLRLLVFMCVGGDMYNLHVCDFLYKHVNMCVF